LVDDESEFALDAAEIVHEAVVDPEPAAVAERMAVGLLDCRPRRGADVREEEWQIDVASDLAQIAVVPGRLDASEDSGCFGVCAVLSDAEAVPVSGLDAEACVEALIDQGVVGLVE
jgi:hypothetical protein